MISIQRVIASALRNPRTLVSLRGALTSTLVSANPFHQKIIIFSSEFWDAYKSLPKPGDFELWIATFPEQTQDGIRNSLAEIQMQPEETWTQDFLVTEITKVLKETAARNAVARLGTMVPDIPVTAMQELADEIKKIEPVTLEGLLDLRDVAKYAHPTMDDEERVGTGFQSLDRFIGGFKKEFVFVLADTGVGKTSMLINLGKEAMLKGQRVLHLTLELSAENALRRYYRVISELNPQKYKSQPQLVIDRVNHFIRFAKGSIHVLYRNSYSVSVENLEGLVDQYVDLHGGIDVLILDYLDLMEMPKGFKSTYEALGILSHRVRNICSRNETTVISATQATRGSHRRKHLRLDEMGDSYKKAQAADIVLGIVQTDEELEAMQARLSLLKVRENPGRGVEIPVYFNLDLMLIADLDHPNTARIIAELGHQSTSVFVEDAHQA